MTTQFAISFALYFIALLLIGFFSYKKKTSEADFILGGRSVNYFVTAISAHASDMSSWLFMAFPAAVYVGGLYECWMAVGIIIFMFLNWHFIAPKIRIATEKYKSLTFSQFFEKRFDDKSGIIGPISALMAVLFFSFYVSAGIVSMGFIFENVFGINYFLGIIVAVIVIIAYISIGGFTTIAWTDFFQGLFLLAVILVVPIIAFKNIDGIESIKFAGYNKGISFSMFPDISFKGLFIILMTILSWGLGYFGQPHIITKFMGIKNPENIHKSKWIGMTWQTLSLIAASLVGLVAIAYFPLKMANNELVFVEMTKQIFPGVLAGLALCGILAATISTIDSQVLVLSSVLTEDFYKKFLRKNASSKEMLLAARGCILFACLLSLSIACSKTVYSKPNTIYWLAIYAWAGLGSAFGPIIIMSLYSKKTTRISAFIGILVGGCIAAIWPLFKGALPIEIPTIVPGFLGGLSSIYISNLFCKNVD